MCRYSAETSLDDGLRHRQPVGISVFRDIASGNPIFVICGVGKACVWDRKRRYQPVVLALDSCVLTASGIASKHMPICNDDDFEDHFVVNTASVRHWSPHDDPLPSESIEERLEAVKCKLLHLHPTLHRSSSRFVLGLTPDIRRCQPLHSPLNCVMSIKIALA